MGVYRPRVLLPASPRLYWFMKSTIMAYDDCVMATAPLLPGVDEKEMVRRTARGGKGCGGGQAHCDSWGARIGGR